MKYPSKVTYVIIDNLGKNYSVGITLKGGKADILQIAGGLGMGLVDHGSSTNREY
jgi:hypothetical protein